MLLTNDDVLPLDPTALRRLAVIGPNADVAVIQGGGSAAVNPHHAVTVLDGLRARLGDGVRDRPRARRATRSAALPRSTPAGRAHRSVRPAHVPPSSTSTTASWSGDPVHVTDVELGAPELARRSRGPASAAATSRSASRPRSWRPRTASSRSA